MHKRLLLCALALLAIACATQCWGYQPTDPEFRAYWVDAWHDGLKTPAQIDALLAHVRQCKLNAVVAQMRRRGDTYYPSPYEPFAADANPAFDALAYLVQKAHSGSPRIEVHVWFTTVPIASDNVPSNPDHPYNRYPEYLTKDDSGGTLIAGEYWFDPGHPGAQEYTYQVVMDVVNRYDVDGIHLDYIRFGSQDSGYNDTSVARFNAAYNRTGQPVYNDPDWSDWRRAQITNLVRKIYANAIAVKPSIKLSAACFAGSPGPIGPNDFPITRPYWQYLQDWRSWLEEGILDLAIPMMYLDCGGSQGQDFTEWLVFLAQHQYARAGAAGISLSNTPSCILDQIDATRQASPRLCGWSGYSYATSDKATVCSACPVPVTAPAMPWKSSPTNGYFRGTVTYGSVAAVDNATVSLAGPVNRTMQTDGTGFYAFIDLPPGSYTVTASKPGYLPESAPGTVIAGQVSTVDVQMPIGNLTISGVGVTNELQSSVTVTWTTNVGATSQVAYGLNKSCSSYTPEDTGYVTAHSVVVSGLQPLTAYYFRVVSRNPDTPLAVSDIYAFVTGPSVADIIIDNQAASFLESWFTGAYATTKYGPDYRYYYPNVTPTRYGIFTPNLPAAGNYEVYEWHPEGGTYSVAAPFVVNYNGGSQTYTIDQTANGGQWNHVATKPFAAGTSGNVTIHNNTTAAGYVMADAVRFTQQLETVPPSVPQDLQAQAISTSRIDLDWTPSTDNIQVAGYRVYRHDFLNVTDYVIGASTTNSFVDVPLAPNTRYTYMVSAYDTAGNRSGNSSSFTLSTLSLPPTTTTVSCSQQAGVWHASNPFAFTAVGGFGPGTVSYYRYYWDTSPTHTWTGSEWTWMAGVKSLDAVSGPDAYYLHLRSYNSDGLANGAADLGPYYLDETAPPAPTVTDDGDFTPWQTQLHASWEAVDPESGVCGYEFAVGTTPGGTDVLDWTPTTNSEETAAIPAQDLGTLLYIAVRAKNCADAWGEVGVSDGITVGLPVGSAAEARALADGTALTLSNKLVSAVYADCFFIQDDDRAAGVRVEVTGAAFSIGDRVNVSGVLSTVDGERRIIQATAAPAP